MSDATFLRLLAAHPTNAATRSLGGFGKNDSYSQNFPLLCAARFGASSRVLCALLEAHPAAAADTYEQDVEGFEEDYRKFHFIDPATYFSSSGALPLHFAAYHDRADAVEALLAALKDQGVVPDVLDVLAIRKGSLLLHLVLTTEDYAALQDGFPDFALGVPEALVDQQGDDDDGEEVKRSDDAWTTMSFAAVTGSPSIVDGPYAQVWLSAQAFDLLSNQPSLNVDLGGGVAVVGIEAAKAPHWDLVEHEMYVPLSSRSVPKTL